MFFSQNYTDALEILLPITGELHPSMWRIYLNAGIYYEDKQEYEKAFDWFHKWSMISKDLYGMDHPKTQRCVATFSQGNYIRIAEERGIPLFGQ